MSILVCILIIGFVVVLTLSIYFGVKKEGYSSSSMTSIGSFNNNIGKPPKKTNTQSYNNLFPIRREKYEPPIPQTSQALNWNQRQTIDRLDSAQAVEFPSVSSSVTPYNVDVADPTAYSFMTQAPRVIRKDPIAMQADPFRGDIPMTMYPDVPMIERSQYGRDSLRLDGAFSEALSRKYDQLTGKNSVYFNMPTQMSNGASITN